MHYLYVQNDLSNFHESSSSVNLELNNSKCKVLRITQRHNKLTYPYKLNNTILESTDCERDLGVLTSSTLTWSQQVDYLCNKATKMLGYLGQLNAWLCPRLHDIMRECFTRDLWEMRLFEFLRVATFI